MEDRKHHVTWTCWKMFWTVNWNDGDDDEERFCMYESVLW